MNVRIKCDPAPGCIISHFGPKPCRVLGELPGVPPSIRLLSGDRALREIVYGWVDCIPEARKEFYGLL